MKCDYFKNSTTNFEYYLGSVALTEVTVAIFNSFLKQRFLNRTFYFCLGINFSEQKQFKISNAEIKNLVISFLEFASLKSFIGTSFSCFRKIWLQSAS